MFEKLRDIIELYKNKKVSQLVLEKEIMMAMSCNIDIDVDVCDSVAATTNVTFGIAVLPDKRDGRFSLKVIIDKTIFENRMLDSTTIARMLLEEKPILIFDDSLSALDTETDLMIREALKETNKNTTTIIITHRISTARSANKIIVLDKGTISDIGTHDELINKDGFYKRLWDIQGSVEEEFLKLVESEVA